MRRRSQGFSGPLRGASLVREVAAASGVAPPPIGPVIRSAQDIVAFLAPQIWSAPQEMFVVLHLNTARRVTATHLVSLGTLDAAIVSPRDVFRRAIQESAAAIICGHNHPSADPEPSPEDVALTRRLSAAGKILTIELLDHVVIGSEGKYVSLAERGLLS